MSCTDLTTTDGLPRYKPTFNPDTDTYEDKNPYKPYERKEWYCGCIGKVFINSTEYKTHIRNTGHKRWVRDYKYYNRDFLDEKEKNKELLIKCDKLEKLLQKKEESITICNKALANSETSIKQMMVQLKDLNAKLKLAKRERKRRRKSSRHAKRHGTMS